MEQNQWFKDVTFYQIWTRSFADCNGDGIGDLYGVYDKLDYIRSLGVGGIWFSPLYPSPNADYGYDISDYRDIHPDFGDLRQFQRVLDKAHRLGMRVLMDLVVNHTSDEHPWFQESRKSRNNPYSDYYSWRDKPNNWDSLFEGKAWTYDEERGQYYLHLFSKKQPDLNMDNPRVRREVREIMRFWLNMGVDGFREDVISFISKREGLPNGLPIPAVGGMMHYKDGPHIHEYLGEFRRVAEEYGAVQIGESPMTTVRSALHYLTGETKSMDMMISFDHMLADCIGTEYMHLPFSLRRYKRALTRWQYTLAGRGAWNVLYVENHDHPRIISRYGSERYWRESGTMLAVSYLFLQGTPFIYQGQEIGMTNIRLRSIDEYRDIASKQNYERFLTFESPAKRLRRVHLSSRDSARTPMQWNAGRNAGFTAGKPWFVVNPNYRYVNVEREERDRHSILQFYRRCIALRSKSRALLRGSYREFYPLHPHIFMYERVYGSAAYLIVCNFRDSETVITLPPAYRDKPLQLMLDNYPGKDGMSPVMEAYEARVYRTKR